MWKESGLRNTGSKMSVQVSSFFPLECQARQVRIQAIQASQVIVFVSVTFGLNAPLDRQATGPILTSLLCLQLSTVGRANACLSPQAGRVIIP